MTEQATGTQETIKHLEDEGDMVLVPRGLLGAAAHALDTGSEAPKTLAALRHYALGKIEKKA